MKKVHLLLGEDNLVEAWGTAPFTENSPEVEIEDDDPFLLNPLVYKYTESGLVKDQTYEDQLIKEQEELANKPTVEEELQQLKSVSSAMLGGESTDEQLIAKSMNHALKLFVQTLPEDKALEVAAVYPEWEVNKSYKINEYVRYGLNQDKEPQIYRILQEHKSQADWTPDKASSLFKKVGFTEMGTPTWVQPVGSTDAYQKGDEVSHKGVIWTSSIDNNVWEPGVYGWTTKTTQATKSSK